MLRHLASADRSVRNGTKNSNPNCFLLSTPVSGSRRRSGRAGTGAGTPGSSNGGGGDSDDYDSSSDGEEISTSYLTNIGRVVWAENTDKKSKGKETWFPALIVAPSASDTVKIDTKEEFLIRSFKDGRYYTVSKKDTNRFHKEAAKKSDKDNMKEGETVWNDPTSIRPLIDLTKPNQT